MKLISRKAAIAAITPAAGTAGTMTAPAMAVEKPANTVSAGQQDGNTSKKDDNAGKKDGSSDKSKESGSSDKASGSSDKVAGSSEWLFKKNDDQKTGLDSLKDWLTLLTTIGSLLGALYTIGNNLDRLNRNR